MSSNEPSDGWERVKFTEIVSRITERVDNPQASGLDRYIGLEHLDPDSTVIRRWGAPDEVSSTKLRFYPGDVIYGRRRAYQRKLGVADFHGICSTHALVLRAKPDVCLPEFLPYFLHSDAFHQRAIDISVGSLSPTINWGTLAQQEFALPPIDEQPKMVRELVAIDRLGISLDNLIQTAMSTAEAVMSWRLNELSPRLQRTRLGDIASWYSGSTPKAGNPDFYGGDMPFVVTGDLNDGLLESTQLTLTAQGVDQIRRIAPPSSIFLSRYGTIRKFGISNRPMATSQTITWAECDTTKCLPEFLLEWLRLGLMGRGSTHRPISRTMLGEMSIDLPSLEDQLVLVEESTSLTLIASAARKNRQEIKRLRAIFLSQLLGGRGVH